MNEQFKANINVKLNTIRFYRPNIILYRYVKLKIKKYGNVIFYHTTELTIMIPHLSIQMRKSHKNQFLWREYIYMPFLLPCDI